jgi:hypothetical protein
MAALTRGLVGNCIGKLKLSNSDRSSFLICVQVVVVGAVVWRGEYAAEDDDDEDMGDVDVDEQEVV